MHHEFNLGLVRSRRRVIGSLMAPPSVNASTLVPRDVPTVVRGHARKVDKSFGHLGCARAVADFGPLSGVRLGHH